MKIDGMPHHEFEQLVGATVQATVQMYSAADGSVYFKQDGLWYGGES